jgi:protein arginine kinase activator
MKYLSINCFQIKVEKKVFIMNCDRCRNIKATIHLTEIIRDNRSEVHLCEACAREMGLNTKLSNFSLTTTDMLSFLDLNEISDSRSKQGDDISLNDSERFTCEKCGSSFLDFKRTGKLGCENCFQSMRKPLASVISACHGEKMHVGKIPHIIHDIIENPEEKKEPLDKFGKLKNEPLSNLKKKLEKAVAEERYEEAALLRDLIKK